MARTSRPLWKTSAALLALFVFDLIILGQGILSTFTAALGLVILAIGSLWASARGHADIAKRRASRAALFIVLGVATWGTLRFHAFTAEFFAGQIIAACRDYEREHGSLPDNLNDLVPEFLEGIPPAKLTLSYGRFRYSKASEEAHILYYVAVPPALRRIYNFEADRWSQLD